MSFTKEEIYYFSTEKIKAIHDFEATKGLDFRPASIGILEGTDGNYVWFTNNYGSKPNCPDCGREMIEGTLVERRPLFSMGYPRWFCSIPACSKKRSEWVYNQLIDYRESNGNDSYLKHALRTMNLSPALHNYTLATFKNKDKAINTARAAVKANKSIFLHGAPGTGKTHLATGLLIESGVKAANRHRFVNVPELFLELESAIKKGDDYTELIKGLAKYYMVVLDDLGATKNTDYKIQTIDTIINSRIMENRMTIITSNLDLDEVSERFDERLSSRLGGFEVMKLTGSDYRKGK